MRLDLNKLEVFLEAGRTGSYRTAARRLHVTPSAVSHALRKLESGLGRTLVEWQGKNLVLTDEGKFLHEVCSRVFEEIDEAGKRLASGSEGLLQHLVVGATIEFGTTVLVRKLRPLLAANPWLRVDFRFAQDLAEPLLRDEVDLAVDCRPHHHPEVQRTALFREKYVVVTAPAFLLDHPIRVPLDLERVPVLSIDKEGDWWRNMLRALPENRRPVFKHLVEINHVRGLIQAAMAGYGVAFVPKYSVLQELAQESLVALFPRLQLLDDQFSIYQKRTKALRAKNQLITQYLRGIDLKEFGGALGEMQ